MATDYAKHVSTRATPQTEPIPGSSQVENSAGGYSFEVDCWARFNRFLILGGEGGSYYATERKLTQENAAAVMDCFAADPQRTIDTIVDVSVRGKAPKNDPAIFALAMLSKDKRALEAMPKVCRIGTHLFQFVDAARHFRGRGRAFLQALRNWYLNKELKQLAYGLVKYQQRDGWSHRDVLRLCKPRGNEQQSRAFGWACGKSDAEVFDGLEMITAFEHAKRATSKKEIVGLIEEHELVRECIPTQFLNEPDVWNALLQKMPMTAMIRNLGKMTSIGVVAPMSDAARLVADRLTDIERLKKARVHPLSILIAMKTYSSGRGIKGSLAWSAVPQVNDALDDAFYMAFEAIEPTNKRWMLGVDVSGSMCAPIAGMPLQCREAATAMAMVAARTEPAYYMHGFSTSFVDLGVTKRDRLADALNKTSRLPFAGTDCSLPMVYALQNKIPVDVFTVYTDSETYAGRAHPPQALQEYREKMGIDAKLIVCGMVSNGFSIADPNDPGMLDVVGFSTDVPSVMSEFVR